MKQASFATHHSGIRQRKFRSLYILRPQRNNPYFPQPRAFSRPYADNTQGIACNRRNSFFHYSRAAPASVGYRPRTKAPFFRHPQECRQTLHWAARIFHEIRALSSVSRPDRVLREQACASAARWKAPCAVRFCLWQLKNFPEPHRHRRVMGPQRHGSQSA